METQIQHKKILVALSLLIFALTLADIWLI